MTNEKPMPAREVVCSAGCKRTGVMGADEQLPPGWEMLQITGRLRCPDCYRELKAAQDFRGAPAGFSPDPLPKTSIGGLKKLPEMPPLHEGVKP